MNWKQLLSSTRADNRPTTSKAERSEYEVDYDRIIFSLPFRRLQDKTQVFPLPEDDFVHNRLTHSLEVASVGRSLGKLAGERIIAANLGLSEILSPTDFGSIVSAASLAHDVGNPPFGHSGENAISDFFLKNDLAAGIKEGLSPAEWTDLTSFEGNAQGFRLINQSLHGLKLTGATLGAFTKYPRQSVLENHISERVSQKKFGYYQSEKEIFKKLAANLGLKELEPEVAWARHPLAFLVEAADDICYHIIDLEDGCTLGLVSLEETVDLLRPIIGKRFDQEKLNARLTRHEKLGTLRALAINTLIGQVVELFALNESGLLAGEYDCSFTNEIGSSAALSKIKELSINKIYRAQVVLEKEIAGFEVLDGLLATLVEAILEFNSGNESPKTKTLLRILPNEVILLLQKGKLYQNLRIVLDYISGMTDSHALAMYRKFRGMSMPSW